MSFSDGFSLFQITLGCLRLFQMVLDCFILFHTLVSTPLIQVFFLEQTFNVHSHAQNTKSKNTLQILQSTEFFPET